MQHKDVKNGNVHIIHNFEFQDVNEMNSYVGSVEDLNKICLVNVPYSFYALKSIEPIEWKQLGGVEASGNGVDGYTKDEANQLFTTEEEVNGIIDEKIENKQESYNISATEYKCGYSRNGKEVFGIEVDCGALPNATTKTITITNYNDLNSYWIDTKNSYARDGTTKETISLPFVHPIEVKAGVLIEIYNKKINITTNLNRTNFTETKVVLNYTKG